MAAVRVGYVLRYWPAASETFVAREVAELQRRGVEVEVAALGRRDLGEPLPRVPQFAAPRGLRRLGTLRRPADLGAVARLARWQRRRDALARGPWLRRLAHERGWDRVHVHFAGEALEVAVAAVGDVLPVSVTVHAVDLFRPRPSLPALLPKVRVVTVCEHHRRWLRQQLGVPATVVRCGIDPERYPLTDPGGAGLRVLCVARDVPKKGLDDLRAAVLSIEGAHLRLTAERPSLAHPRVTLGVVHPADALFLQAEVFALAARVAPDGDRDGVPVALMEAMASGLPVVCTRVAGLGELVDDEVGWCVPPDDPEALRRALRQALADPAARREKGAAARRRVVAEWTLARQVDGLLTVWSGDEPEEGRGEPRRDDRPTGGDVE